MGHKTQSPTTQNDSESDGNPPGGSEPVFFFFKIILSPALQDYKLSIPNKFAKEFSNDLSSTAKLIVPATQRWTVRIHSEGGKLWFCDGLRDFFEYYSVSCGYFFVFYYRRNSEFGVRIFDLTTCEIEYKTPLLNEPELLIDEDEEEEDLEEDVNCDGDGDDVVVLDRPMVSDRVDDVIELSSDDDDDDDDDDEVFEEKPNVSNISLNNGPCTRKRKMEFGTEGSNVDSKREYLKVEKKAKGDHSPKNASFRVTMMPYNIDSPLNIPPHIGRKYPKGANGFVMLEVSGGRTWTVEGNFLKARLTSLGNGWLEFARDNKLKVDMVCVFELIESNKEFRMKVSGYNPVLYRE